MAVKVSQYFILSFDGNNLGRLKSMNLKIEGNVIETSNFNTAVTTAAMKGRNNVTIDVVCIYDQANEYVEDVVDNLLMNIEGNDISLEPLNSASGDISYTCTGFPMSANWDYNDDDRPEISATFIINSLFKGTDGSGIPLIIPFTIS